MKQMMMALVAAVGLVPFLASAQAEPRIEVSDLVLEGQIEGENIVFSMQLTADVRVRDSRLGIVQGDVACLDTKLPRSATLAREGDRYLIGFASRGRSSATVRFASRAAKEGDWRRSTFLIPASNLRRISVVCDREDLDIAFPGALNIERRKDEKGRKVVSAVLGASNRFEVRWKPETKKLEGELAVECDANAIASASVGALVMDQLFTFRVVQGALQRVAIEIPADINVTEVNGADIQDWRIAESGGVKRLEVVLSRPYEDSYRLGVRAERVLPEFPCRFDLPVLVPRGVIRTSGFLMVGTDSAIKLLAGKLSGLTQVDHAAFPRAALDSKSGIARPLPARSAYAYQYANLPYSISLSADDIVSECSADDRLILSLEDNDLTLAASVELEFRDAPARDVTIAIATNWTVSAVSGSAVSDYDVRDGTNGRSVHVYFQSGLLGRTLVDLRLEHTLAKDRSEFSVPVFRVEGAKAERGYLVLTAEKGQRLKADRVEGLREVHAGSMPVRVADAQHAFRFREAGWSATVAIERTEPTLHAEILTLASIGEGVLYGSASITYHISGAPVRQFRLTVPAAAQNVEFNGRDIRGWARDAAAGQTNGAWAVTLQEKVIGDYTLLVTYDQKIGYDRAEVDAGGIETVGTGSEVGYIVLASGGSFSLSEGRLDAGLLRVDREEIPQSYTLLINDPVLAAYTYGRKPHVARVKLARYGSERLLDQVLDHTAYSTRIGEDGESVTAVEYFIKNTSQQYLSVALPKGSRLWTVRRIEADGSRGDVAPLKGEEATLIPIGRPRDPNVPIRMELTYAQTLPAVGVLGRRMTLEAPVSKGAPATLARWTVQVPKGYEGRGLAGSSMAPDRLVTAVGLERVLGRVLEFWGAAGRAAAPVAVFLLFLLAAVSVLVHGIARRTGVFRAAGVAMVLIVAGAFAASLAAGCHAGRGIHTSGILIPPPLSSVSFTRTLSLADGGALSVSLQVVPRWLGVGGSFGWFVLLGLAGLAAAFRGFGAAPRSPRAAALAVTLLALAAANLSGGRIALTVLLAFGLPLAFVAWLLRGSWRCGCRRRPPEADPTDDGPFAEPPPTPTPEPAATGPSSGAPLLLLLAALGLAVTPAGAEPQASAAPAPQVSQMRAPSQAIVLPRPITGAAETAVVESVSLVVEGPGLAKDVEKSAKVTGTFEFSVDEPTTFRLLDAAAVVSEFDLNSRHLRLRSGPAGCSITALSSGRYTVTVKYLLPVAEQDGEWSLAIGLPANLRNRVVIGIPERELDVRSDESVYLSAAERGDKRTEITAAFGPVQTARVTWRPRVRKTRLEKTVFFAEVNTLAVFQPGVVELTSLAQFQIAQGEIRAVTLTIPAGMSVNSVAAPGLSTWRFDPETHRMEAVLERPAFGDFGMVVQCQIPRDNLPYEAAIGAVSVKDAARQRGSLAFATPETVQIGVDAMGGLSAMNIADFSPEAVQAAARCGAGGEPSPIKRAFRYQQVPATAAVRAEAVLPEIRVAEKGALSIADERVVLSSQLDVSVAKAGVFALRLDIPADFDIETLTGTDVSHWDEVKDEARGVVVHFQKQALGSRAVNLVISRMERGIEGTIVVPRIAVRDARKHTGTLTVSGERGVRLTTVRRDGVSEVNPRELGLKEAGLLAFRILRPDWQVSLQTEVLAPTIKPEVLQCVDLAEGMIRGTAYIRYAIENAGCKTFRIQAPQPGTSLTMAGRNIAKAFEVDKDKGIWQLDFQTKVEDSVLVRVSYQTPYDTAKGAVTIRPLRTLDTEGQKGYLVVRSAGREQIRPTGDLAGLKPEDARSIPPVFGAEDMSDAILCYRTLQPEYQLELAVRRHGSEEVLPARVTSVRMTSVLAADRTLLTRVALDLQVGDLRFLQVTLPNAEDALWSAFVNGKVVKPSRDGRAYRIPLEEPVAGEATAVEIIAAGRSPWRVGWSRKYYGPQFNLPLNDVQWVLYTPPGRRCFGFGGTFKLTERGGTAGRVDAQSYAEESQSRIRRDLEKAKVVMAKGEQYARQGKQKEARQALEAAMNFSQAQADFNEDARIQYRNLVRQQAFVGLVQRRNEMQQEQPVQDQELAPPGAQQGFRGGNFTPEFADQIAQALPAEEGRNLKALADKIIDQQAAASAVSHAIRVTVPEVGPRLVFQRALQIHPDAPMYVSFRMVSVLPLRWLGSLAAAAVVFGLMWAALRRAFRPAAG